MKTKGAFIGFVLGMLMLATVTVADDCCATSTVRVLGTGQLSVEADIAIIYASIMKDGATVNDALNSVQTSLNAVEQVLKQNKIPKSDIQTSYISVYPKYDYSSGNGVINGYTVYLSLTITIRGIDKNPNKVGNVIEGIANAGVNSVSGITYDSSKSQSSKSLARKAAFVNAFKKAKQWAQMSNAKLGRILKIDQSNEYYYPYYTSSTNFSSGAGGALGASAAVNGVIGPTSNENLQLPVGKVNIIVNVAITWILIFANK